MSFNYKRHWGYLVLAIILLISIILNIIYIPKAINKSKAKTVDNITLAFFNGDIEKTHSILGEFSIDKQNAANLTEIMKSNLMKDAQIKFKSFSTGNMFSEAFNLANDNHHFWSITSLTNTAQCGGDIKPSCAVGADLLTVSSNDRYDMYYTSF